MRKDLFTCIIFNVHERRKVCLCMKKKKLLVSFLVGLTFLGTMPVPLFADELSDIKAKEESAQAKSDALNEEINRALQEVNEKSKSIDELVNKINETKTSINKKEEEIQVSKVKLEKRKEVVAKRLQAMQLENSSNKSLKMLLEAENFSDFISRAVALNKLQRQENDKIQSLLEEKERITQLIEEFKTTQQELEDGKAKLLKSKDELSAQVKDLQKKYASNEEVVKQLKAQKAKIEAQKAAEEAQRKKEAAEQARLQKEAEEKQQAALKKAAQQNQQATSSAQKAPTQQVQTQSAPVSSASISLNQFLFQGVVYSGGYKFTYYSQSVLPGGGLVIPGRHVNAAGYVSDGDGYIVAAGSMAKGTVIPTPFGAPAKIYDRGTYGNHIDIYIR